MRRLVTALPSHDCPADRVTPRYGRGLSSLDWMVSYAMPLQQVVRVGRVLTLEPPPAACPKKASVLYFHQT